MLDFRELIYITTVAETKNFSQAAARLKISQPSLSQYIQKVEEEIGSPLFDRSRRPMILTTVGEEYISTARKFIMEKKELEQKLDDLMNLRRGHISIGIISQRGTYLLPKVLPLFKNTYPEIEISLLEENSGYKLEKALIHGDVDVIISSLPLYHDDICYEVLTNEKLYIAIPPYYDVARYSLIDKEGNIGVNLQNLRNESFIMMPQKMKLRTVAEKVCKASGFTPKVILETYNIYTAQQLVTAGFGVAFLMETLKLGDAYRVTPLYLPILDKSLEMPLVISTGNHKYVNHATRAFIALIKEQYITL